MKKLTIEQRIAKRIDQPIETIIIEEQELRENNKGESIQSGSPVYFSANLGVEGEPSKEFAGWVINDKFYCGIE